jgi:hypothetical protein
MRMPERSVAIELTSTSGSPSSTRGRLRRFALGPQG